MASSRDLVIASLHSGMATVSIAKYHAKSGDSIGRHGMVCTV